MATTTETARKEAWELCQDATRLWNSLSGRSQDVGLEQHHRRIKVAKSMRDRLASIGELLNRITLEIEAESDGEVASPLKLHP